MDSTSNFLILLLLLIAAIIVSCAHKHGSPHYTKEEDLPKLWNQYKEYYDKQYANESEDKIHMEMYRKSIIRVSRHNKGNFSYTMAINYMSDMTRQELMDRACRTSIDPASASGPPDSDPLRDYLPAHVDWREKHIVTHAKDQRDCGACWAFSTAAALESHHAMKHRELLQLSEQNLIDCSTSHGTEGCNGGKVEDAISYVVANRGLDTESSYPYEETKGRCRFKMESVGATCAGIMKVKFGDRHLMQAVADHGPIIVLIDGSGPLKDHDAGVYYNRRCSSQPDRLNHSVLLIGYGETEKGEPYWLIKNSWGHIWAENGFFKLARNVSNHCGVSTHARYPIVN